MCGRYTLDAESDDIARRFNLATGGLPAEFQDFRPNYNVAPTQIMPVVTEGENGERSVEMMKWGIPRILGKDVVKELINTRADKAFGGFWRKTVANRRCLIPATGFYEWRATKEGKIPFFIHPKDEDMYAFAGIWDIWKDEHGREIKTYSIMTSDPNKEMKAIHTRMPVILHQEDEAAWLKSSEGQDGLERLLFPSEDDRLEVYEVRRDVNSPRNNNPGLLEPAVQ